MKEENLTNFVAAVRNKDPSAWWMKHPIISAGHYLPEVWLENSCKGDFPGSPVVKTPCSQGRGPGFVPFVRELDSHTQQLRVWTLKGRWRILRATKRTQRSQINKYINTFLKFLQRHCWVNAANVASGLVWCCRFKDRRSSFAAYQSCEFEQGPPTLRICIY